MTTELVELLINGGMGIFALAGLIVVIYLQQKTIKSLGMIISENTAVTQLLNDSIKQLLKK